MRQLGSFLPGEGRRWRGRALERRDAGAGRASITRCARTTSSRYGKAFIPADMPVQDWPMSLRGARAVLRPVRAHGGRQRQGGQSRGRRCRRAATASRQPRDREYPLPALEPSYAQILFADAAAQAGYHPFPAAVRQRLARYTNPDGSRLGACVYCGHCERFGCEANAKGSPHITVIPKAMAQPNFELRTHAWVTKVMLDSTRQKAVGVVLHRRLDRRGVRAAGGDRRRSARYAINNVHLHAAVRHRHAVRSA